MANDLNLCQFIGRLGKDPEFKATANGTVVANISLACGWKSGSGEGTEWVRVVAFGKLADIIQQYVKKGDQIYINGRMQTRKWQAQDGSDRYSTEIVANTMQMLGSKNNTSTGNTEPQRQHQPPKQDDLPSGQSSPSDDNFDDIPF